MSRQYINNLETRHIELHFEKAEYMNMPEDKKKELKSAFVFSGKTKAWVSRSTLNHYRAIETAKNLGFTEEIKEGKRLSYAEELEIKQTKAEARADRMEGYAANAEKRAENLQAELNSYRGDVAFFTQPNINSSGGRAFTNYRNKVYARYDKGFSEYRKSEYFKDRASTSRATAEMKQLDNPVYLDNRIKECNSIIRKYQARIVECEEQISKIENGEVITNYYNEIVTNEKIEKRITEILEKMEYEIDKLATFENWLEEVSKKLQAEGKKLYSRDDIKVGYLINVCRSWAKVLKVNPKTVEGDYLETHFKGCFCQFPYSEIKDMKIPDDWKEKQKPRNPFLTGNILTRISMNGSKVLLAYQVVKASEKTISIQEIEVINNVPQTDNFKPNSKPERKTPKLSRQGGEWVVNDGSWYLYKYTPIEKVASSC